MRDSGLPVKAEVGAKLREAGETMHRQKEVRQLRGGCAGRNEGGREHGVVGLSLEPSEGRAAAQGDGSAMGWETV